ncbi:MAG TPA: heavy metal translocating P-type ATPase, partial [Terrimesophilobacter sp.]|nr:heavy metal translocating P-type ATPase [Terrimesophilobacter sp.]
MSWLTVNIRRYPIVAAALLVGVAGLALSAAGQHTFAQWGVSGFAVFVALLQLRDMIRDLMTGSWGIDVLAIVAIGATVAVGEYWAALIITLMLSGGEALEDYAEHRAKRELSNAPRIAHRLANGADADTVATVDVPVDEVVVGDRLLVRPGEVVPVNGVLETADASFDEASLTGESLPVDRGVGDTVRSGAVNGPRAVVIRASAAAADSQYQQIVALVTAAAESKAPLVRLADRYAVPFTIVSLLIAGVAWALSGDPVRFAEVLVVATPCPLLIAAPVAFMGGMSRSAR